MKWGMPYSRGYRTEVKWKDLMIALELVNRMG